MKNDQNAHAGKFRDQFAKEKSGWLGCLSPNDAQPLTVPWVPREKNITKKLLGGGGVGHQPVTASFGSVGRLICKTYTPHPNK